MHKCHELANARSKEVEFRKVQGYVVRNLISVMDNLEDAWAAGMSRPEIAPNDLEARAENASDQQGEVNESFSAQKARTDRSNDDDRKSDEVPTELEGVQGPGCSGQCRGDIPGNDGIGLSCKCVSIHLEHA